VTKHTHTPTGKSDRSRRRKQLKVIGIAAVIAELSGVWRRGYRLGGNVIVRCRRGHLFTTIWIPGASVKSLRFGWWRGQRCPVGKHWSIVTPVRQSELTEADLRLARANRDVRLP